MSMSFSKSHGKYTAVKPAATETYLPSKTSVLVTQAMGSGLPSAHKAKGWVVGHFPALLTSVRYQAVGPFAVAKGEQDSVYA